jgi:1-acyl-sn-glycerol-3-phosphate acyltransferase
MLENKPNHIINNFQAKDSNYWDKIEKERRSSVDKIKSVLSWASWSITYGVMYLLSIFHKVETIYEDRNFLSVHRPIIVISNHRGIFDPWHISSAIPFKILFGRIFPIRVYSSVELSEKNTSGRILKTLGIMRVVYFLYNAILLPKSGTFDEKIQPLLEAIKKNESILIFPEGQLIFDDSISDFKKGVVRVHQLTGALILPIAIKYEKKASIFRKVNIVIGKPFAIPEDFFDSSTDDFRSARNYLREKVISLYEKI